MDTNLLKKIVAAIQPEETDNILEIGPGGGALTEHLLKKVNQLTAVEIDEALVRELKANPELKKCRFINQDILRTNLKDLLLKFPVRVVGNIPYNITSPLLFWLIEQREHWIDTFLMVQKELADRLTAPPGTKIYGRLTVMVSAFLEVEQCFDIPPTVFIPQPKVRSVLINLKKLPRPLIDEALFPRFEKIVKTTFSQRRKMLKNTLNGFGFSDILQDQIDLTRRPETLSVEEFAALAKD